MRIYLSQYFINMYKEKALIIPTTRLSCSGSCRNVVQTVCYIEAGHEPANTKDTNSRYERNNGRIEPHFMCGKETKQEAKCTSTAPD